MNWLDLALVIFAVVALASGIREGFSRGGFGVLALIAGFFIAAWLCPANAIGFVVVFVASLIAAGIFATLVGRWFRGAGLTWLDRVLGGAFGLTNAVVMVVVAAVATMAFASKMPRRYVEHSVFAPYAVEAAHRVVHAVPDEMKSRVEGSYDELVNLLPAKFRKTAQKLPREI